jgi:hypothetical protein
MPSLQKLLMKNSIERDCKLMWPDHIYFRGETANDPNTFDGSLVVDREKDTLKGFIQGIK